MDPVFAQAAASLCFVLLLGYLAWSDALRLRLPLKANLALVGSGLLGGGYAFATPVFDRVIGCLAGFLILYLVARLYRRIRRREGIGAGDPVMLAGIGAWLGWSPLPAVILAAALMGIMLATGKLVLSARPAGWRYMRLPLGSLLAAAACLQAYLAWDLARAGTMGITFSSNEKP